jgi:hypothetical protein
LPACSFDDVIEAMRSGPQQGNGDAMRKRSWLQLAVMLALAGCSSCNTRSNEPQSPEDDEPAAMCVEGAPCTCYPTLEQGTLTCEGGHTNCYCPPCQPPLQLSDAPTVQGCGGEPFGTWRLVDAVWGRSKLSIMGALGPLGECDLMTTNAGAEVPQALMTLHESGRAEYFSAVTPLQISYRESCVTSQGSIFSCGSDAWTGVSNCSVDCDVCTCDTSTKSSNSEDSDWARTEEELWITLYGQAKAFAYCLTGDQLEVSTPGAYVVFERVNKLSKPTPCAGRTPMTCLAGQDDTCRLGACVGPAGCDEATSEGNCLTMSGCTWNPEQCLGVAQARCGLGDFGVVPGCELTTQAVSCQGTPEACESRLGACSHGCAVNTEGRCSGDALQCDMFSFCPISCGSCNVGSTGEIECAIRDEFTCDSLNENYEGEGCTWERQYCEGSPIPCGDLPAEECDAVPGCQLVPMP